MTESQNRLPLSQAVQQHAPESAAALLSQQYDLATDDVTMDADKDILICDAGGGSFTVTLPLLSAAHLGKYYTVREVEGTNDVTVDGNDGTINGSATFNVDSGTGAAFLCYEDADGARAYITVPTGFLSGGTALEAANNLDDLTDVATARANLAVTNLISIPVLAANLVAADTDVRGFVYNGPDGTITSINTVLEGAALAGGDATLTAKIGATPVTNGVVTITAAGSAPGDKDSATPTAANAVTSGDYVSVTVGGANTDTAARAMVTFQITIDAP